MGGFTPKRATKFFVPLLLQAFSQSLTYPLVAAIVSHGELGVNGYAAFAQGQTVMFLIGALASGLILTGMVYARTRASFACFKRLNYVTMVVLLGGQMLFTLPPFYGLVFGRLLGLPPELTVVARNTLGWGAFMQLAFFLRNMELAILYNARASFEANIATTVRLVLTVASSPLFVHLGWTGPLWGVVAMTGPCYVEYALTHLYARKYIRALPEDGGSGAADQSVPETYGVAEQFRFTVPLSLGGVLIAVAPLLVAVYVGCTENSVAMLAIHYVTIGVANPVAFGALRMQAVAIQFPPEWPGDRRMLWYALCSGVVLGTLPLVFTLPCVANWYFCGVQNLPAGDLWRARVLMGVYALAPMLQALRGRLEGLAAWMKRPKTVMAAQIANVVTFLVALSLCLGLGLPGWQMGAAAIISSAVMTILFFHVALSARFTRAGQCDKL